MFEYSRAQICAGLAAEQSNRERSGNETLESIINAFVATTDARMNYDGINRTASPLVRSLTDNVVQAVLATRNSQKAKNDPARTAVTLALALPALLEGLDCLDTILDDQWDGTTRDQQREELSIAARIKT